MPSDTPSMSPSVSPSHAPSISPSAAPTHVPSISPTATPTGEAVKTKTANANVFLVAIPREMDEMNMARFEIMTLEFIRDTMPHPTLEKDGYEIEVLAVTVLTQTVVFPDDSSKVTGGMGGDSTKNSNSTQRRNLQGTTSSWDVALQVGFRTVGVVMAGQVPANWDFTEITNHGFTQNYDQYLWQLGSMEETDFFKPLFEFTDGGDQVELEEGTSGNNDGGSKGKFVAALLLSFLAIGIAAFASYFAIRQHLRKKRRRNNRKSGVTNLSGALGADPTRTLSDDVMDEEYGSTGRRILASFNTSSGPSIEIDEQSLESVGLTPRNQDSPIMGFGDEGMPADSLNASPTTNEDGNDGMFFNRGTFIKKWLTPRRSTGQFSSTTRYSTTSTTGRFDPPENASMPGYNYGKPQDEPDAKKEASQSISGQLRSMSGKETIDGSSILNNDPDDGQYTVPISMFSTGPDGKTEFSVETPLASVIGSEGSSYMGGLNIQKTFTGCNNSTGDLQQAPTNPIIHKTYAFSEVTGIIDKTSSRSLINQEQELTTTSDNVPRNPGRSDTIESKIQAYTTNLEADRQHTKPRKQNNLPGDLESRAAVEVTLGARSMSAESEDENDLISPPKYRYNNKFSATKRPSSMGMTPNTTGKPSHVREPEPSQQHQKEQRINKPVRVAATATSGPGFTLGARPMGAAGSFDDATDEEDNRSTLSSVVRRSGAYDVYAPSGPIGIVVDTSKDGPSVHSLKSTSPMMGLITPGDLIVALDDVDTRSMSAAALTRLMAKKSRQRERKITLYSMDGC